jgi:mannosyl-oligosaccharide glucosidase
MDGWLENKYSERRREARSAWRCLGDLSLIHPQQVPQEFQTQVPNYANPPTLTMAVTALISHLQGTSAGPSNEDLGINYGIEAQMPLMGRTKVDSPALSPETGMVFFKSIYKPLKRHYDWFRRTQRGQIKQYSRKARSRTEGYRWRGRSELHVLTSGMDDYPRGPPHAGELHLDLISWMAFFTRTMKQIAAFVGEKDDELSFSEIEKAILENIEGKVQFLMTKCSCSQ